MRSGLVFEETAPRFEPFSTCQARLEDNAQIAYAKYSHTGHDEC